MIKLEMGFTVNLLGFAIVIVSEQIISDDNFYDKKLCNFFKEKLI